MEGVRTFLESSTIHGLTYISTTKRLVRLFWVLIVIGGFTGAGVLIYQSFQNWAESPVTTTIETLPIKEVIFPKVTVCPPKGTFTDLNYDIMVLGNMSVGQEYSVTPLKPMKNAKNPLLKGFVNHFLHMDFETMLSKISSVKEKEKYRNWYIGMTKVPIGIGAGDIRIDKSVETFAPNGEISTPFFGDQFEMKNFALETEFSVSLKKYYSPYDQTHSCDLSFQMEYYVEDNDKSYLIVTDGDSLYGDGIELDPKSHEYKCEKKDFYEYNFDYKRSNPKLYFEDLIMKRFTGFSVKWNYDCSNNEANDKLREALNIWICKFLL